MNSKANDIQITLAALLHDIGKFYQRTGAKLNNNYYEIFMKNNGYKHAAFTAQFVADYLDSDFHNLLVPSAEHHTSVDSVIKIADIYASGHDRKSEESHLEEEQHNYITARMYSIFNILFEQNVKTRSYINLSKQQDFFPSSKLEESSLAESKNTYKKLFEEMVLDVNKINAKTYLQLHHYLYPIIKEYTTTIPSSTFQISVPTVSLFDHLKLTAAIANCLCKKNLNDEKPFLVVEYDLSGIQNFIYKITEGASTKPNVAKSLRTRSFYLNLLCDFIAYAVANEFGVTYENILYTSGGRGQVLVPNYNNAKAILQDLLSKVTLELFKVHHTDLSFSFTSIAIDEKELQHASFRELIYGENRELLIKKSQKFITVLKSNPELFTKEPLKNACLLCESYEVSANSLCTFCNNLLILNDKVLANSNEFVVEYDYINHQTKGNIIFSYGSLGQMIIHSNFNNNDFLDTSYYQSVNEPLIGETKYYARSNISGMSFEKISKNSQGDPKLAVVKMDVDNLGWIFSRGFKEDKTTISKILTLSRNIDFFFSKVIVDICNLEKFKNSVYVNYSGGDDLVIILPASMSLDFINEVNKSFNMYTGNHEEIHLSAGLEIFLPKSPVRFAIVRAEEQLSNAKAKQGKASTGIFGEVVSNKSLSNILDEIKFYEDALSQGLISRTGLYNIYLAIMLSLNSSDSKSAFQRYIPNIAYSIARNITNQEFLLKVKNTFIRSDVTIQDLKLYKIIYAYVLMRSREED